MSTLNDLFVNARVVGSKKEYKDAFEAANITVDDLLNEDLRVDAADFPSIVSHSDRIAISKTIEQWKDKIRGFKKVMVGGEAPCSTFFKFRSEEIFKNAPVIPEVQYITDSTKINSQNTVVDSAAIEEAEYEEHISQNESAEDEIVHTDLGEDDYEGEDVITDFPEPGADEFEQ